MADFSYTTQTKSSISVDDRALYPDTETYVSDAVFVAILEGDSYSHSRLIEDLYSGNETQVVRAAVLLTTARDLADKIDKIYKEF